MREWELGTDSADSSETEVDGGKLFSAVQRFLQIMSPLIHIPTVQREVMVAHLLVDTSSWPLSYSSSVS